MDLWIRSQDKMNLVKIRQISLNYSNTKQIIANYMPDIFENSGKYYELLATYETKERALEILDEIQQILKSETIETETKYIDNQVYETKITRKPLIPKNIVIYEMPKG